MAKKKATVTVTYFEGPDELGRCGYLTRWSDGGGQVFFEDPSSRLSTWRAHGVEVIELWPPSTRPPVRRRLRRSASGRRVRRR